LGGGSRETQVPLTLGVGDLVIGDDLGSMLQFFIKISPKKWRF
jgi:hypothetical protein